MKLIFDVHCQGQYLSNRSEIEKEHELICVGHHDDLPQEMEDHDIAIYAKTHGYCYYDGKKLAFTNHGKYGEKGAWELYDLRNDRTETNDLSQQFPDRVTELSGAWKSRMLEFRATALRDLDADE